MTGQISVKLCRFFIRTRIALLLILLICHIYPYVCPYSLFLVMYGKGMDNVDILDESITMDGSYRLYGRSTTRLSIQSLLGCVWQVAVTSKVLYLMICDAGG